MAGVSKWLIDREAAVTLHNSVTLQCCICLSSYGHVRRMTMPYCNCVIRAP